MSKKKETTDEPIDLSFITRGVTFVGDEKPHGYIKKVQEGKDPVIVALGFVRTDPQINASWMSYTVQIQGGKIISMEISELGDQASAWNAAKISFETELVTRGIV